ncbi:Metal transporter CNNM4 [Durusdinium trenchii]|uniref:Metal transporter CNNM4 n=1 Tax=Durusdinium trenchii TaxID=1381693 RepID=A0ABP0MFD5_9DINO
MFHGMELEHEGIFESSEEALHLELEMATPAGSGRKQARVDWKGRYMKFKNEVPTFRDPFRGGQIKSIRTPDDVAYCKCRLRSDLLCADSQRGVYLEVEVVSNPDNLSLAVVDFESGGRSSVTFSPDTGAVIREKKLRESPSTLVHTSSPSRQRVQDAGLRASLEFTFSVVSWPFFEGV